MSNANDLEDWRARYLPLGPSERLDFMFEYLRLEYESGNAAALLDAVNLSLHSGGAPEWVRRGFFIAWHVHWGLANARTLDEAFEIHRPTNWRQGRARKSQARTIIHLLVKQQRRSGEAIGQILFAKIADELNEQIEAGKHGSLRGLRFNAADVQRGYYAVEKQIRDALENHRREHDFAKTR